MGESEKYHCGIDPGATGGIGIIDSRGQFVAAHRWDQKNPARLYKILLLLKGMVDKIYIELINAHPGEGIGHVVNNMALVQNWGIWQGFCYAAGIPFTLIHPHTWQAATGLRSWQARQKLNPAAPSPLSLARRLWPAAPLPCLVDDGKAVALLLADLARRDSLAGIDRAAMQAQAHAKTKAKAAQVRKARKAQKALASDIGWWATGPPPAPGEPKNYGDTQK
jgi:hypothetical protein